MIEISIDEKKFREILDRVLDRLDEIDVGLHQVDYKLTRIYGREMMMTQEVTQLVSDVENLTSVEQANETAISGAVAIMGQGVSEIQSLAAQIASSINSGDTATLQGLSTKLGTVAGAMKANQDALAGASSALSAAVVANTPAAATGNPATPAPTPTPVATTDTGTQLDPSGNPTPGSTTSDTPVGG